MNDKNYDISQAIKFLCEEAIYAASEMCIKMPEKHKLYCFNYQKLSKYFEAIKVLNEGFNILEDNGK